MRAFASRHTILTEVGIWTLSRKLGRRCRFRVLVWVLSVPKSFSLPSVLTRACGATPIRAERESCRASSRRRYSPLTPPTNRSILPGLGILERRCRTSDNSSRSASAQSSLARRSVSRRPATTISTGSSGMRCGRRPPASRCLPLGAGGRPPELAEPADGSRTSTRQLACGLDNFGIVNDYCNRLHAARAARSVERHSWSHPIGLHQGRRAGSGCLRCHRFQGVQQQRGCERDHSPTRPRRRCQARL